MAAGRTIQLHSGDNVVVCAGSLADGEDVLVLGRTVRLRTPAGIGHKLACRDIRKGEHIIKYGVPIGTATDEIPFGAHVHTHNMKSDYIATLTSQNDTQ